MFTLVYLSNARACDDGVCVGMVTLGVGVFERFSQCSAMHVALHVPEVTEYTPVAKIIMQQLDNRKY